MASGGDSEEAVWEWFDLELASEGLGGGEAGGIGEKREEASGIEDERPEKPKSAGLTPMPPPPQASGLKRKASTEGDGREKLPRPAPPLQPLVGTTRNSIGPAYPGPPSNEWHQAPPPQTWIGTTRNSIGPAYHGPPSNEWHQAPPPQTWIGTSRNPVALAYPGPSSNERHQAPTPQPWIGTTRNPVATGYAGPSSNQWHPVPPSSSLASMPQWPRIAAPYNNHLSIHFDIWIKNHFTPENFFKYLEGSSTMTVVQFWGNVQLDMTTQRQLYEMKRMQYLEVRVRRLTGGPGRPSEPLKDIVILNFSEKEEEKWRNLMDYAMRLKAHGETVTVVVLFQPSPEL